MAPAPKPLPDRRNPAMKHLWLIGLLLLGPLLAGCKTEPESAKQRAIDACQNARGSHGNNYDCIR
jgi:hypothetical protein